MRSPFLQEMRSQKTNEIHEAIMVYLYHFSKPYHRAQHYLGSTCDLERRDKQHRSGHGSPLIRAAIAAGCTLTLIPLYPNESGGLERAIKKYKNSRRICPLCCQEAKR